MGEKPFPSPAPPSLHISLCWARVAQWEEVSVVARIRCQAVASDFLHSPSPLLTNW